jgi:hypothetical protein
LRTWLVATAGLLLVALASGNETAGRGVFCVSDRRASEPPVCRAVDQDIVEVEASARDRSFVWIKAGVPTVRIGQVSATMVRLKEELPRIHVAVLGTEAIAEDAAVRFSLTSDSGATWKWSLPAARLRKQSLSLAAPAGRYALEVESKGMRPAARRRVDFTNGDDTLLGSLRLVPLPRIRGTVVTAFDGKPLGGVAVSGDDARLFATTEAAGTFAFRVPEGPIHTLTFSKSGLAPRALAVSDEANDVVLPAIRMGPGGSLRVDVRRECTKPCRTRVLVSLPEAKSVTAEHEVRGEHGTVSFERLDPGDYNVVVRGEGELQQKSMTATVVESEIATVQLDVHDRMLVGSLSYGNQPLPNTRLNITRRNNAWNGVVATDPQGLFEQPVWENVTLLATIPIPGSEELFRTSKAPSEADRDAWDIHIPDRLLTGRVVDEETGAPVAGARVLDDFTSPGFTRINYGRFTDREGVYRFFAVSPGRHLLRAKADGYIGEGEAAVVVEEGSDPPTADFRLRRGGQRHLHVVDGDGQPIAEPFAIHATGPFLLQVYPFNGSASGELVIPLPPTGGRDLFVWAFGSGFAFARVQERDQEDPLVVVLPPPVSTLRLSVHTPDRRPVPNISFLIKHEGRLIPPVVFRGLAAERHVGDVTAADGMLVLSSMPAGTYQIAAFIDRADAEAILAGPPSRFRTVVALPGPVTVEFTAFSE